MQLLCAQRLWPESPLPAQWAGSEMATAPASNSYSSSLPLSSESRPGPREACPGQQSSACRVLSVFCLQVGTGFSPIACG